MDWQKKTAPQDVIFLKKRKEPFFENNFLRRFRGYPFLEDNFMRMI